MVQMVHNIRNGLDRAIPEDQESIRSSCGVGIFGMNGHFEVSTHKEFTAHRCGCKGFRDGTTGCRINQLLTK